jgi:hypothetical protein
MYIRQKVPHEGSIPSGRATCLPLAFEGPLGPKVDQRTKRNGSVPQRITIGLKSVSSREGSSEKIFLINEKSQKIREERSGEEIR